LNGNDRLKWVNIQWYSTRQACADSYDSVSTFRPGQGWVHRSNRTFCLSLRYIG